jgi:hypothetical protein
MTPREELHAWVEIAGAVLDRDIQLGKATAVPDAPEIESPLLRACQDARDVLEWITREGGWWQGQWVDPERYVRLRMRRAG